MKICFGGSYKVLSEGYSNQWSSRVIHVFKSSYQMVGEAGLDQGAESSHCLAEMWVGHRQTVDEDGLPVRGGSEQREDVLCGERRISK